MANPQPGRPGKAQDDATIIAEYVRRGTAPATLTDVRNHLKHELKAAGIDKPNTIKTRTQKAIAELRNDPWRYQIEWLKDGNQLQGV